MTDPHYKRGTICKDGKLYGRYPDGSLYRIYSTTDRPFLQLVDVNGETFLRIRQATEQGYTDCREHGDRGGCRYGDKYHRPSPWPWSNSITTVTKDNLLCYTFT